MKKVAYLLAVFLLAGCQGHKRTVIQSVLPDQSKLNSEQRDYMRKVTGILESAVSQGKGCTFSVSQNEDGLLDTITLDEGEPISCSSAIQASVNAANSKTFPSKPAGLPYKLRFVLSVNKSMEE